MFYRIEFLYNRCLTDIQQLQAIIENKSKQLKDIQKLNKWLINNQINLDYQIFNYSADALNHANNINDGKQVYTLFINPVSFEIYIMYGVVIYNNLTGVVENIDNEYKKRPELNIRQLF